ncbi:MAG: DUF255 domain-containing protein [Halobacteriales archaeon]|nr:DUF255 domain-containing protein [Halobacteriales archaeon]
MDESADVTNVAWQPFGPAAFETATRTERPILLSLTATWCSECQLMDREAYAEPRLAANINDDFVPVRVDVDRHPRVRDRYNMGGFPSTVFLTPAGELLTGATYLSPEALRSVLERVRERWADRDDDVGRIPRSLRSTPPDGDVTDEIERLIAGQLREQFDAEYAGWGTDAKFPMPRTVEFALKRERTIAERTLDAIRQHLTDTYGGGFFRYATERDWSDPRREKLLDENASLLRAYANAYCYTGEDAYRETAADTMGYLTGTLWTGEAFAGSQAPGDPEQYHQSPSDRERADEPAIDETIFADRNALAAEALLTYYAYTDDDTARRYAERTLEYLTSTLLDDGTVRHFVHPTHDATGETGLLADQARAIAAFTTAAQVLDSAYIEPATAAANRTIERLQTDHGFIDGPAAGPGLLDRPLYSIDMNAELADALIDLHWLTGTDRFLRAARTAIGAFAGAKDRFGVQVAGYGAAAARLVTPPLRIEIGGPTGSELHRAALRIADHEKVVVPDAGVPAGTAVPIIDGERRAPVGSPDELLDAITTSL